MKTIDIQAFEDRSRPMGGHAVICLMGVTAIVRNAAFVLRPLDGTLDTQEAEQWPSGESAPVETRATDAGMELVVGPGIVDHPLLVPGTPVKIDLPHEGVSGEFLWPSVTLLSRPRRRALQVGRTDVEPASSVSPATVHQQARTAPSATPRPAPRQEETNMSDATSGAPPPARARAAHEARDITEMSTARADNDAPFYASARAGTLASSSEPRPRVTFDALPKSRRGAAFAAVAGLLAVQAFGYLLFSARTPSDAMRDAAARTKPVETPLFDLLRTGDTSPAGIKAGGVAPARMLELANTHLLGDAAARNTEEAAFWLKRYFVASSGDERSRRAMTQLGTTYAAPSTGAPDYASARQIWEIAAAQGDPVAMCFIAKLLEGGLSGAVDRAGAERWTEMARSLGGCNGQ